MIKSCLKQKNVNGKKREVIRLRRFFVPCLTLVGAFDARVCLTQDDVLFEKTEQKKLVDEKEEEKKIEKKKSEGVKDLQFFAQLISQGEQLEKEKKYQQALSFYQAAEIIDKKEAQKYVTRVSHKLNEANHRQICEEEKEALLKGAKNGNADDAYRLGKIYLGEGMIDQAVEMFDMASQRNHTKAPYKLAVMFEKGDRVPVNMVKAEQYYKIGAKNGNAHCAYVVAKLLEIHAQQDKKNKEDILKESLQLLIDAADRGHAVAAMEVGYALSEKGDHVNALRYFSKAKQNANADAVIKISLVAQAAYNIAAEKTMLAQK